MDNLTKIVTATEDWWLIRQKDYKLAPGWNWDAEAAKLAGIDENDPEYATAVVVSAPPDSKIQPGDIFCTSGIGSPKVFVRRA